MHITVFSHVYSANVDVCGFMEQEFLYALEICDGVVVVCNWWMRKVRFGCREDWFLGGCNDTFCSGTDAKNV